MKKYRPIELKDLNCDKLDGKYIKDSNSNEEVMVVGYVENVTYPVSEAILNKEYLDYGDRIDDYMLLRNFEIEVEENEKNNKL